MVLSNDMVKEALKPVFQSTPEGMVPILKNVGVERLTREQMEQVFKTFTSHVRVGLGIEKGETSLHPRPSYLSPVSRQEFAKIHSGELTPITEIGGTHIYGATVTKTEGEEGITISDPIKKEMSKRKYKSADEFFDEVQGVIAPLFNNNPQSIGLVWSFPGDATATDRGVDTISSGTLPKELSIPGIHKSPVGEQLLHVLGIDPSKVALAVLNDTVAVLFAGFGKVGGVIGTGINFATTHEGKIYNLEAGEFLGVPQTELTQWINTYTDHPDERHAEKQISALYVAEMFNHVLDELIHAKELDINKPLKLQAEVLSSVLEGDEDVIQQTFHPVTDKDKSIVYETVRILTDRSAQIAGAMVAALAMQLEDVEVTVPIEGSFFNKAPGYKETMQKVVDSLVGNKKVTLVGVEQSGIKGAAIAALTVGRASDRRDAAY